MKLSIIVPVKNGEQDIVDNIRTILNEFNTLDCEIIIINDGSSDDTTLALNKLSGEPTVKVYHKPTNCGKGAAIKTGFKLSTGDYCAIIDADLQIHPCELKTFIKLMDLYDADVVIGDKRNLYSNVEYSFFRNIVSVGYHIIVKALFRFPLRDTQCGLKLFKRKALQRVINRVLAKRFAFDLEVLVAIRDNNYRIIDAPVKVTKQMDSGSVSLGSIIDTLRDTLAVWYRRNNGWYKMEGL